MDTLVPSRFRGTPLWQSAWPRSLSHPLLAALLLTFACAASTRAHEIGMTRVSVLFHQNGTYDVDIVTDAGALVEKLEAVTGSAAAGAADPAQLEMQLARFDEPFRQRVRLAFDGVEVRPAIAYSVAAPAAPDEAASPAVASIRLTGPIPIGSHHLTWSYAWTFVSYALTLRTTTSESSATEWLEGGQSSTPLAIVIPAATVHAWRARLDTAWRYLTLGFTHIVPGGLDHVLFLLGLYLLAGRGRAVLWQVSAFTVAHAITLGLSIDGVLAAPPRIVEPLIALSIVYVGIENIVLPDLTPWRVALVFAFGLLHGMGCAGALEELGLPRAGFAAALMTFNLGVAAGQLTVIGSAFVLVGRYGATRAWYRRLVVVPVSLGMAGVALYWTIERLSP